MQPLSPVPAKLPQAFDRGREEKQPGMLTEDKLAGSLVLLSLTEFFRRMINSPDPCLLSHTGSSRMCTVCSPVTLRRILDMLL